MGDNPSSDVDFSEKDGEHQVEAGCGKLDPAASKGDCDKSHLSSKLLIILDGSYFSCSNSAVYI